MYKLKKYKKWTLKKKFKYHDTCLILPSLATPCCESTPTAWSVMLETSMLADSEAYIDGTNKMLVFENERWFQFHFKYPGSRRIVDVKN